MVEEAQLITKIKTAFPKEESEHKDIHGTELVAVAVGILLSLAFITYSNSSSFFIMLVICLMGGFFGYFYQREKITEFISSIFNPSKKKQKSIRDKTPSNSTSDPHKVEEIIVEKPEKLPEPLEERLKLYKNNQTGEDVMKNKELNAGSSMFGGYHVIQPPVVSLNALRKSSVQPSKRRSIHEQVTNKVIQNSEWNRKNGNQLIKDTMLRAKRTLNPQNKIFDHGDQNLFVQE